MKSLRRSLLFILLWMVHTSVHSGGHPSLISWNEVKSSCPQSCGNKSYRRYLGTQYLHDIALFSIKECNFSSCQDDGICPVNCRLYEKSENIWINCASDDACNKTVHQVFTPVSCNISACGVGHPPLISWNDVKGSCPQSCGSYSTESPSGTKNLQVIALISSKDCNFGACQANNSVFNGNPWYTDDTICPVNCRLYEKSEDTLINCTLDDACNKTVHWIYTPTGCNISACPATVRPPSLLTWSTVKGYCPHSCGNYSKDVYTGNGYNGTHIFYTTITKNCYFGACEADDSICPVNCRLYEKSENILINCSSDDACNKTVHLIYTPIGCNISACPATVGPPSLLTWSTVKRYCPHSCGNYSKDVYTGNSYNGTHIFNTTITKNCYFGACEESSPWDPDETICPLMCRIYRKCQENDISSCISDGDCYREVQFVYTPYECNISACQGCPFFIHVDKTTGQSFEIKETIVGRTIYTRDTCDADKQPMGKIMCLDDKGRGAIWGEFSLNQKCNLSDLQGSPISNVLKNITQDQTRDLGEVLQVVVNITMETNLTEVDLLYMATILEKIDNVASINTAVGTDVLKIYKKVLQSEAAVIVAQQRGNVANRILRTVDTLADKLIPGSTGHTSLVIDAVGLDVWDLKKTSYDSLPTGLHLTQMSETLKTIHGRNDSSDDKANIMLQIELLQQLLNDTCYKSVRLSRIAYMDTQMFSAVENPLDNPQKYITNSKVIGGKVFADGKPITDLKGFNVTTAFLPIQKLSLEKRRDLTLCAYWDFSCNDNSGCWLTDGCYYMAEEKYDVCVCNHLTNFAVLLAWDDVKEMDDIHTQVLSVISVTGLSLSVSGLSITLLTPIVFRKLRQTDQQRTLMNLALAEICAWIVFLAGFSQTQSHVGCIVAAALLHYFILASFIWMLAEAVMHYRLFVKVLGLYTPRYMLKIGIPAWGVPLLPVLAVLAIDPSLYMRDRRFCWLSLTAMYYAFALPVGLIILCNIIIYIMVVTNIWRKRVHFGNQKTEKRRTQINWKVSALSFVLFGLSWIFGFMAVSEATYVFRYIFVITSSTQGFVIFLFCTALNKNVRESWIELCCPRKETHGQRRPMDCTPVSTKSTNLSKKKSLVETSAI